MRRLVVIGNGMAGARTVEDILARGGAAQFEITMFGDEPYGNYNRTLLGRVLSGKESEADIVLNALPWYWENNITLHAGVRVDRVDKYSKHVFTGDGRVVPYDVLIIATGSRSYLPPMDGIHTPSGSLRHGVFTFRTMDDTRRMVQFAREEHHRRAVVIGGGLPGVEAARGLRSRGMDVALVRSGGGPAAILGKDRITGIRLGSQAALDCDMVVVAAGVRPNVDVAVVSALEVERAIVVDDQLRVMDEEDIYAVGDCAQYRGEAYGLVAPLWEQAAVLADHVTGADGSSAYLGPGRSLLPASRVAPRIQ
ncbi:NAD(P)/FAD-dependent oxidoreductase [Arthrobacter sp. CJ23]|uniref:NAD(P)/FAD-dependent oxidoreductase n=1 Tax=Arthrobacter sp. CJ23 TaxID=2972479 RepID=UPI00215CFF2B|nr:FAD-dependent oxidoreductase [Arthrobacter sp. CJ23]UVJ38789.1 FAD-dependent oxidoreductase [Arthrobacter sp. CJ23]